MQVVKPLYGLSHSGDYCHKKIDGHHRNYLKMQPLASDQGLFIDKKNGLLNGTGNEQFQKMQREVSTLQHKSQAKIADRVHGIHH